MLIEKKVEENGDGPSGHVRIAYKKNLFILFGDPLRINSQMRYLLNALNVYTSKYYNVYRSYL